MAESPLMLQQISVNYSKADTKEALC